MDASTQALVLGISGIASTLIVSGLGLYFTARARTVPLRQTLYTKQIELLLDISRTIGRIRIFATLILDSEATYKDRALDDLAGKIPHFSELVDAAAVLLPTELWVEIKRFDDLIANFLALIREDEDVSSFHESIVGGAAKILLLTRSYLGADELSEENAFLFTDRRSLTNLANQVPGEIVKKFKRES